MRILFCADVTIATPGSGAERVLREQSTRLARRGHDVHIITRRAAGHQAGHELIDGVHEWRYGVGARNELAFILSTIRNAKRLFERLHREAPFDCINHHQPFTAYAVTRSPLSRAVRTVYTCLSLSFEEYESRNAPPAGIAGRIKRWINIQVRRHIERASLAACDAIVTLSRFTNTTLEHAYRMDTRDVRVIAGGVDLERFSPVSDRTAIRRRLGVESSGPVLFTVRDLEPRMGLDNLITAMRRVADRFPGALLIIGGKGSRARALAAQAASLGLDAHVLFTGFIAEADLPDYYRGADLFVLPTRELEGFGLVTVEALACGTPAVGTPVGGTVEILGGFEPGFLFADTGADGIATLLLEKCASITDNPDAWHVLGQRCRRYAQERYSWESAVDELEPVLWGVRDRGSL